MNTDMIDSDQQSKSDPIFVVGMNGSGTTMMLDCLDNHPNLYGFRRETLIIPYFIKKSKRLGNLSNHSSFQQLWQEFTSTSCFYYLNDCNVIPLPPNWQQLPHTVATIIDQTFLYFAHKAGKKRWCEKTPRHAIHIEMLAHHFPNAKFIHMIRDGRACAASFHRRWQYNPQQTIYRWKNLVHEAKRQGAQVKDRYLEIPFEGLTSNPEPWMRRVCDFINEPFEPKILGPSRTRNFTGSESAKIEKKQDVWRDYFSPEQLERLEKIAGKTLHELDYKTTNKTADANPSPVARTYWTYLDFARRGVDVIWRYLSKPETRHWDSLSGKIKSAIRQRFTTRL